MLSTNPELAAAVRARLIDALGIHSPADEARLAVTINGGCAVLRGCVHSWAQHEALERAALATPGVAHVDNQLALLIKAHPSDRRCEAHPVAAAEGA